MNLEQALAASLAHLAYRRVGDRRVIVDQRGELLIIQIQRRLKSKRWMIDDDGGGVRYLEGVWRDGAGRYLCASRDLTCLAQIGVCLPLRDQILLLETGDDWFPLEQGSKGRDEQPLPE